MNYLESKQRVSFFSLKFFLLAVVFFVTSGVAHAADTIKVGVLHSLSGTMAISETSLKDVAIGAGCHNVVECSGEETNENLQKALADKDNAYVIISKIKSGNVPIKPIPLNAVTIRDRFRKEIGLVPYL